MKKITLLLFIFSAFLFSCDELEEANTVPFNTSLSIDIPVVVVEPASMATKSATETTYTFSGSGSYSLSSNTDISEYLNKIKSISITRLDLMFSGLGDEEVIKNIDVEVEGVGVLFSLTDVSASSANQSPAVDNVKLTAAADKLRTSKSITIKVSGTTNKAPMNFTVGVDFDLYVEATVI